MTKEIQEWPEPQQAGETDNAFFLRVLEAHRQSHLDWAECLKAMEKDGESLTQHHASSSLGTAEMQMQDVRRYDKLIAIFKRLTTEEPFEKPDEGEWVQPIESGYKMRCCDCGLTHGMDFRVYEGRAQFRVFRLSDAAPCANEVATGVGVSEETDTV